MAFAAGSGRALALPATAGGSPARSGSPGRPGHRGAVHCAARCPAAGKFCAASASCTLRSLLGSGRAVGCVTPARVLARTPGGLTLACPDASPGAAVLDAGGRYAGTVTSSDGNCCTAAFTAAAGLCGSCVGLATPGKWVLTGLPADCTLTAGEIVTTPGGDWLGMLAAAPVPDADGLTASAPLTDTADLHAAVYFVRTD